MTGAAHPVTDPLPNSTSPSETFFFWGGGVLPPCTPRFALPFPLPLDMLFKARHSVTLFKRPVPNDVALSFHGDQKGDRKQSGEQYSSTLWCHPHALPEAVGYRIAIPFGERQSVGRFSFFLALPAPLALDRGLRFPCARQSSDAMV